MIDRIVNEEGERERFSSEILPPYLRRPTGIDDRIPWLYLRGIRTCEFRKGLQFAFRQVWQVAGV